MGEPRPETPLSLETAAAALPELWWPRVLGQANGQYLKVARIHGEFPWHAHANEDELFLVLRGAMTVRRTEADGGDALLRAGEFLIVPRGMRHATAAADETLIALFEPVGTAHTGEDETPLTRSVAEQLG